MLLISASELRPARACRVLAALAALACAAPCGATLYSTSGGYQYTAGSRGYWGHDLWTYGGMRLEGGWYPFGQFSYFSDANFDWGVAPSLGLQKGIEGLGRPRVAYTFYEGGVRGRDLNGTSHQLELGWFRAFTPRVSGDLAYRYLNGDLFGGVNDIFDASTGGTSALLRHSVFHQGLLTAGYGFSVLGKEAHAQAGLSAASGTDGQAYYTESLGLNSPPIGPCALSAGVTFLQARSGPDRVLFTTGLSFGLSGRFSRE